MNGEYAPGINVGSIAAFNFGNPLGAAIIENGKITKSEDKKK
jgi:predicted NBD/HSP70 family sugar kinase